MPYKASFVGIVGEECIVDILFDTGTVVNKVSTIKRKASRFKTKQEYMDWIGVHMQAIKDSESTGILGSFRGETYTESDLRIT